MEVDEVWRPLQSERQRSEMATPYDLMNSASKEACIQNPIVLLSPFVLTLHERNPVVR